MTGAIVCFAVLPCVKAQQGKTTNRLIQSAVDALLAFIQLDDSSGTPYVVKLETLYDNDGLIGAQRFSADPTLKNIRELKVSFPAGAAVSITYNARRYDFFGANGRVTGMDYKDGGPMTVTVRFENGADGRVNAVLLPGTGDGDKMTIRRVELNYDGQGRIVLEKEFKPDLSTDGKANSSTLCRERAIRYLEAGKVEIMCTYRLDGSMTVMYMEKTGENSYRKVIGGTVQGYQYDDNGKLTGESYITAAGDGWEKLTGYDDADKISEDYRLIRNGSVTARTVTLFLPEGNLKQYYDGDGLGIIKEELNFKTRRKVNGEWTIWKY
ncbi:hypothetical protein JCM10512_2538 [Bacteroides reticulotermitis JCM 10512]|uniref:Uncharacterized protein n=1 Tax=Bacteroides reticulotermitis JCM 10512 TaxID=1445607 RepID=W4UUL7_9BACE|nr:hypothetical protein JCM10512_2538 [Bacteroides reticulotermitis JCM 10512]